ncbi:hypothetical protein IV102_22135 [bacterium]|nr:hypothetical protein [bacterium]
MTKLAFQVLDLVPIHRGNLVARVKLQMTSGMILSCSVLRSKTDHDKIFVTPVAERHKNGAYTPIVDFASPEVRDAWQAAAQAALRSRWAELVAPPATEVGRYDCQF